MLFTFRPAGISCKSSAFPHWQQSGMLTDNFETHARRFLDPALAPAARLQLAQEIRESIEIVQTSEYVNFLQHFVRAFNMYLRGTSTDGSPYFIRQEDRFNTELPTYKTRSGIKVHYAWYGELAVPLTAPMVFQCCWKYSTEFLPLKCCGPLPWTYSNCACIS